MANDWSKRNIDAFQERKNKLDAAMKATDSDMFEHFATLDWWRLHDAQGYLYKRIQLYEMRELNI